MMIFQIFQHFHHSNIDKMFLKLNVKNGKFCFNFNWPCAFIAQHLGIPERQQKNYFSYHVVTCKSISIPK